jgi:hypothetical protein
MTTIADIRNIIFSSSLQEQTVTVPAWAGVNLIVRELSGKAGSDLLASCTDPETDKVDQTALVGAIILATLRNVDEPNKPLVFSVDGQPDTPNPIYRDQLMTTVGLGTIMQIATASIKLSGLDASVKVEDLKNASAATSGADLPIISPVGSAS